jgi:mono/diheme cytochrome c family protein
MRQLFLCLISVGILCCLALPSAAHAQSDAARIYKANCVICHSADGSGDSATGKAMHAKDLRSEEVQKQSDAELAEVITKGRGKMPAFGAKLKPDDVTKLVAYIRGMANKK